MNKLIVVFGLPGSGKSTVAHIISEYLGDSAVVLRTDEIRKELFPTSLYTQEESDKIYAEFYRRACHYLEAERTVIMDGVFGKKSERSYIQNLAESIQSSCQFIYVTSNEKRIKERLNLRKWDASEADYEVYLKLKSHFEAITGRCDTIDNSWEMLDLKSRILSLLNK